MSSSKKFSEAIRETLESELGPEFLEVIDESAGHSRRTPENPETHFKVIVVSQRFEGLTAVKRQQLVFGLLGDLFKAGLHALSQQTFTPEEWAKGPVISRSPVCAKRS